MNLETPFSLQVLTQEAAFDDLRQFAPQRSSSARRGHELHGRWKFVARLAYDVLLLTGSFADHFVIVFLAAFALVVGRSLSVRKSKFRIKNQSSSINVF